MSTLSGRTDRRNASGDAVNLVIWELEGISTPETGPSIATCSAVHDLLVKERRIMEANINDRGIAPCHFNAKIEAIHSTTEAEEILDDDI